MKQHNFNKYAVSFLRGRFVAVLSVFLLYSCSPDEEEPLNAYDKSVVVYFKEVALGFEFGTASPVTRKWVTPMKIFIGGNPSADVLDELNEIVSEVNVLATDGFEISITTDTLQSNCYLFFGSGTNFAKVYPPSANHVGSNWGLFYVNWTGTNNLNRAVVYVDIVRATDAETRNHLLREELTQSLGFGKDSFLYSESIFQSDWTTTTEYAEIDRDLIRLLYNPEIVSGLNGAQVDPILKSLVRGL
jgi:hypothetical protein